LGKLLGDEVVVVQLAGVDLRRSSDEVEVLQWWRRGENSSMDLVEREGVGETEGVRESWEETPR
jgi:hypothetical protein